MFGSVKSSLKRAPVSKSAPRMADSANKRRRASWKTTLDSPPVTGFDCCSQHYGGPDSLNLGGGKTRGPLKTVSCGDLSTFDVAVGVLSRIDPNTRALNSFLRSDRSSRSCAYPHASARPHATLASRVLKIICPDRCKMNESVTRVTRRHASKNHFGHNGERMTLEKEIH
eukprot:6460738-Pyramimonas_sp.AAC.1